MTALLAVSLLTVSACSDSDDAGGGSIEVVRIVTIPNNQTLTALTPGMTRTMSGVPENGAGNWVDRPVTWQSTNEAAFTISATGTLTAVAGGNGYLRATAGGRTDSVAVTVRYPVGAITITPAGPTTMRREANLTLTANTTDTQGAAVTGRTIAWSSSNTAVATVSATGVVSATATAADGTTATITATAANASDGGTVVTATRLVTVNGDPAVASVSITGSNANGFYGTTAADLQLTATALSAAGNPLPSAVITWSSTTAATATVSGTGLVDFVAAGTTNIRAQTPATTDPGAATITGTRAIQVAPVLVNGVPYAVPTMAGGTGHDMAFLATAGQNISVTAAGGSGDGDLYVFVPGNTNGTTSDAGGSNFLCRSWNSGNTESCTINPSVAGWYRIRAHAWTPAGAVTGMMVTLSHP